MIDHYQPKAGPNGTWGFTTPTGKSDGFLTRFDALKAAANTERQDRYEAETGKGPIAEVLRKHFRGMTRIAPAELPPLPEGTIYGGQLRDYDDDVMGHTFDECTQSWTGLVNWAGMSSVSDHVSAFWHIAIPTTKEVML